MTPAEARIRAFHEKAEWKAAATAALEGYGSEILGFLAAVMRDEHAAGEVFSQFCEDLWNGLPKFRWKSSFRTWAYTVARNASLRYLRSPEHRRGQRISLNDEVSALMQKLRTDTLSYLRTEVKDKFAQIRESLEPEDQALLILRVDRDLAWNEVAEIMLAGEGGEEPVTSEALARKSAALRKRFERVKEQLKQLAREHHLLEEE